MRFYWVLFGVVKYSNGSVDSIYQGCFLVEPCDEFAL